MKEYFTSICKGKLVNLKHSDEPETDTCSKCMQDKISIYTPKTQFKNGETK